VVKIKSKRKHRRYSVTGYAALKYKAQEQDQIVLHTLITDISLSGIGLYSDVPLEDNIDVSLDIAFISIEGPIKTDAIDGHIVYVRKLEDIEDVYFAGVQFHEEINRFNQPLLYEHLQSISILDKG
jgi:c-di-GMP-binding flagellar brake protein YcgR